MLEMKAQCERCSQTLTMDGPAMICSYECTFCDACASDMANGCPNCSGVLVPRPPRVLPDTPTSASR
jgi:hypothetical protein